MISSTWYKAGLLAFETGEVIHLRLWKISAGGWNAVDETILMVREKVAAGCEASCSLAMGSSLLAVVERYREHVAANAGRLKARPLLSSDVRFPSSP